MEIAERINAVEPEEAVGTAERLLEDYDEDDKELVEPWLLEMAALIEGDA